jgi:Silicon transporter
MTSINVGIDLEGNNIFGVNDGLQNFFNTGFLGAIISTIVAWRIIASSFPIAFLSNPLIYLIIICVSRICFVACVLARYQKPIVNYQPDKIYL